MKILTLATWGCKQPEIFEYIESKKDEIDIFCFQEVLKGGEGKAERGEQKNAYEIISKLLPNLTGYFSQYGEGVSNCHGGVICAIFGGRSAAGRWAQCGCRSGLVVCPDCGGGVLPVRRSSGISTDHAESRWQTRRCR